MQYGSVLVYRDCSYTVGNNAMCGGRYYTVGNNAKYNSRGLRGIGDNGLENFFKNYSIHFPINPAFQEPLVYVLRYKFREAADLQGGGGWQISNPTPPPPPPPPPLNAALTDQLHRA